MRRRQGVVVPRVLEVRVLPCLVDLDRAREERQPSVRRLLEEQVRVDGVVAVLGDEPDVERAVVFDHGVAVLVGRSAGAVTAGVVGLDGGVRPGRQHGVLGWDRVRVGELDRAVVAEPVRLDVELRVGHVDPPVVLATRVVVDRDELLVVEDRRIDVASRIVEVGRRTRSLAPGCPGLAVVDGLVDLHLGERQRAEEAQL